MTQETPPVVTPEARAIEKLELAVKLREARIESLRRERMEMLFPRIESLEEQVKTLEGQVQKLTDERELLMRTFKDLLEQTQQAVEVYRRILG